MNVFVFDDYRECLVSLLEAKIGRGGKVRLAEVLSCQPGYISQVLNKSKIHFSEESLLKVARFLDLLPHEQEFLLILLGKERAGTSELKSYYVDRIKKMKQQNLRVEKQIQTTNLELDDAAKSVYYSHWAYCAIHMLVSIDEFSDKNLIAHRMRLTNGFVSQVFDFLLAVRLIQKDHHGRFKVGPTRIHLSKDSPMVRMHHQNFRNKAIASLEDDDDFSLHYSGVFTIGKSDALKIREQILKLVADAEKIIRPSPNEEMICINMDLFKF